MKSMRWSYLFFELKLLILNRKNWLLGLALVLFFPVYYSQYSKSHVETLKDQKNEAAEQFHSIFKAFPEEIRETEKGKEIYNNLTEQASLVNMQRYYLRDEEDSDLYIRDGLRLNELRLQMHKNGNEGIHPSYVVSKEEIHKEVTLLNYYRIHNLPVLHNPFVASHFIPTALHVISGLPFGLFVLLIGNSMFLHDHFNRTVMIGFPISFMQKVIKKIGIHFVQITIFLVTSVVLGILYVGLKMGWGNFATPMLVYSQNTFIAISTIHYIILLLLSFLLISLFLLALSIVVFHLTTNMYTTVLTIFFFLFLPSLLLSTGVSAYWVQPLALLDMSNVLNGEAALKLGNKSIDYRYAFVWMASLTICIVAVLYVVNRFRYVSRPATLSNLN